MLNLHKSGLFFFNKLYLIHFNINFCTFWALLLLKCLTTFSKKCIKNFLNEFIIENFEYIKRGHTDSCARINVAMAMFLVYKI